MFETRLKKLKQKLNKEKLDGVLVSSVPNITYLTGYSNFFKEERDGYVFITGNGNYILTHSIYSQSLDGKIPHFKVMEITRREPPEEILKKILKKTNATIGIEEHDLRVYEYKRLKKQFKNLKNFELKVDRTIKDQEEIRLIKKACEIGDEVFKKILKRIKFGITEKRLAFELDSLIKEFDIDPSFRTIVAFGANAASPHHESGKTKLEKGQVVLLDFGVRYENYCSDMTRTVFFGKPSNKQKEIYETVLIAQQKAREYINSTIKSGKKLNTRNVDKVARDYIISKGYPSIPHSLGHGIGLEVHEHPHISPKSKEILEEGMVFSIEPGIYLSAGRQGIPNFGSSRSTPASPNLGERVEAGGVRIEDLFVIENDQLRVLTHSNSKLITV